MDYAAISPISEPIRPNKQSAKRHYGVHPWFTRRAWNVVQDYIKTYSDVGDVVLDPFGGSGVTAIEAVVLGRKGIHLDVSTLANFITENVGRGPVDIESLGLAYQKIEKSVRRKIEKLWTLSDADIESMEIPAWYPKNVPLPPNADAQYVHELFTRRTLIGLSLLFEAIGKVKDEGVRQHLLLAFSGTLGKCNRTFVSTKGRKESRGGSTIFSLYRYAVGSNPVELPLWEQFEMRFKGVVDAKGEINAVPGYDSKRLSVLGGTATRLTDYVKPNSVDYIYTDPPYGAHIAYLDLTTMWTAWLGLPTAETDVGDEVIQGGSQRKSRQNYEDLLEESIEQMFKVLKYDRWLSLVFAHKDPGFWDHIVKSCERAGFEYVNTAVQPVGVIWSMHKKKNPLTVLSGELVLNFRKVKNPRSVAITSMGADVTDMIKNAAELSIVKRDGAASTEEIYNDLIPELLESGQLGIVKEKLGDATPLLRESFEFSDLDNKWRIRENTKLGSFIPVHQRIKFYLQDFLNRSKREDKPATFDEICFELFPKLVNGKQPTRQSILDVLHRIATSHDGEHWELAEAAAQTELEFGKVMPSGSVPVMPFPGGAIEHDEIIFRLAKLGKAAGYMVYVGKKERTTSSYKVNGEGLRDLSIPALPKKLASTPAFTAKKIEQIDLMWLDKRGEPIFAFEVEKSTAITTGIDRFIELMKHAPRIAKRIVIVAPRDRQRTLDAILTHSHYIGHPLYMENKLRYLYFDDLVHAYDDYAARGIDAKQLLKEIDLLVATPRIEEH